MSSRIIVTADKINSEQVNQLTLSFKGTEVGYWHWFQNTWILLDPLNRDQRFWRDYFKSICPEGHYMVFLVKDGDWTGFTNPKAFDWLRKNWNM